MGQNNLFLSSDEVAQLLQANNDRLDAILEHLLRIEKHLGIDNNAHLEIPDSLNTWNPITLPPTGTWVKVPSSELSSKDNRAFDEYFMLGKKLTLIFSEHFSVQHLQLFLQTNPSWRGAKGEQYAVPTGSTLKRVAKGKLKGSGSKQRPLLSIFKIRALNKICDDILSLESQKGQNS